MFEYEKEKSLFDNDDEFGLQEYREDSTYVFNANLTTVKIIRYNEKKNDNLQGNFLGVTLASSATLKDNYELIKINIMSSNSSEKELTEHGWSNRGLVTYECYGNYDLDINNKSIIEFVKDFGQNIKRGERFKVKMEDTGLYQGQYTRKQFTLTKINNNPNYG